MTRNERIKHLFEAIPELSDCRLMTIDEVVSVYESPKKFEILNDSVFLTPDLLEDFGDLLRVHHCFSREAFTKDKFEYALERVFKAGGKVADLAAPGQPGFDITIEGQKFSLKTEAAKKIKVKSIHISKFMELGGGEWGEDPDNLIGLREQFLNTLAGIERIMMLRALRKGTPDYFYELVEIPKSVLTKVSEGELDMKMDSTQFPKPGYCYVKDGENALFSLYFDGGGERKLQIKKLQKSSCIVHATWQFKLPENNR